MDLLIHITLICYVHSDIPFISEFADDRVFGHLDHLFHRCVGDEEIQEFHRAYADGEHGTAIHISSYDIVCKTSMAQAAISDGILDAICLLDGAFSRQHRLSVERLDEIGELRLRSVGCIACAVFDRSLRDDAIIEFYIDSDGIR